MALGNIIGGVVNKVKDAYKKAYKDAQKNSSGGGSSSSGGSSSGGKATTPGTSQGYQINQSVIDQAARDYEIAKQQGNKAAMDAAHQRAEAERAKAGYSGGVDGSQKVYNNTSNQSVIDQAKRDYEIAKQRGDTAGMASAHQRAEAERAKSGYSGGVDGSQNVALSYAQNAAKKYTGDRYVQRDDFNIDMDKDYRTLMYLHKDDPQALRLIEEARNEKVKILKAAGITDYDETYDYADVALGDEGATVPHDDYIASQYDLQSEESAAARAQADANIAALQTERSNLESAYGEQLRQLYIEAQKEGKSLKEYLATTGRTGGAVETQRGDAQAAYMQNYASKQAEKNAALASVAQRIDEINSQLTQALSQIRGSYGSKISSAYRDRAAANAASESATRASIISRVGL